MKNLDKETALERVGGWVDTVRGWTTKSWRIALRMTKGAYLLSERRRLFKQLGEEVYYKIQKGEMRNADLEPVVEELNRLSKKVELEERQIRNIRFGGNSRTSSEDILGTDEEDTIDRRPLES